MTAVSEKNLVFSFTREQLKGEVTFLADGEIIVRQDHRGAVTAARNRCRHQGGRFYKQAGCILTCANHGWQLDVSTMKYVNPLGRLRQDQLAVEELHNGELQLFEIVNAPWDSDRRSKEPLLPNEFTIRFYAHACVEIRCGSKSLFTDPWLIGPAFSRGWWLMHQPPSDWLDRLASADAIYISHNHSDHLNAHTLRRLSARNAAVPILVPAFESDSCVRLARKAGMKNVSAVPFDRWVSLDGQSRFMILQDGTGRDDSGILFEYKGHRVLNTVDSQNLCRGALPPAEVLLTSFAGGASGYPVCWEDYPEERITALVQKRRAQETLRVIDTVDRVGPKVYIPFASYFTEAHPSDREIKRLNVKNTPEEVCRLVHKDYPQVVTWIPEAGAVFDIGLCRPVSPEAQKPSEPVHDFDFFLAEIRQSQDFPPLQTLAGVEQFFRWAAFRGDLVLHVIETNEDFTRVVRQYLFDFLDLSFCAPRPSRPHRYLRMRCRSDVFRHVLRHGLPWEEVIIGFQARFYREPDVYNFDFWDHFQNRLPKEPLQWEI